LPILLPCHDADDDDTDDVMVTMELMAESLPAKNKVPE